MARSEVASLRDDGTMVGVQQWTNLSWWGSVVPSLRA